MESISYEDKEMLRRDELVREYLAEEWIRGYNDDVLSILYGEPNASVQNAMVEAAEEYPSVYSDWEIMTPLDLLMMWTEWEGLIGFARPIYDIWMNADRFNDEAVVMSAPHRKQYKARMGDSELAELHEMFDFEVGAETVEDDSKAFLIIADPEETVAIVRWLTDDDRGQEEIVGTLDDEEPEDEVSILELFHSTLEANRAHVYRRFKNVIYFEGLTREGLLAFVHHGLVDPQEQINNIPTVQWFIDNLPESALYEGFANTRNAENGYSLVSIDTVLLNEEAVELLPGKVRGVLYTADEVNKGYSEKELAIRFWWD